jgi:hypothetical protein
MITVPAGRVVPCERKEMIWGIGKIILRAEPDCIDVELRWVVRCRTEGSGMRRGETRHGPRGQNLSKPTWARAQARASASGVRGSQRAARRGVT